MADFSTILSALTFGLSMQDRREQNELEQKIDNFIAQQTDGDTQGSAELPADIQLQQETNEMLEKLIEHESVTEPGVRDRDSFASATVDISPGETAVFTVEPQDGYNLRVKEVYMDRRTDHDYTINVGGDVTSVSHRAKYARPKAVLQSDRVIAEVTNNSSSTTTIDFELEAWAEPGGS